MKPQSAKAKGRRLQNQMAETIRERFNLAESDVKPAVMGETGADIHLSAAARAVFPFAVECKNQERLNIWQALAQADKNAGGVTPLLVFKRNRGRVYVALELERFLEICGGPMG